MSTDTLIKEKINLLKQGIDQIKNIHKKFQKERIKVDSTEASTEYKKLCKFTSLTAHIAAEIYNSIKEDIWLPIMVVINRFISSNYLPRFPEFWKNIDVLEDLYAALEKDGYCKDIENLKEDNNEST